MKKAQSLSMNTIIVAALALLVLIIIAMIFAGKIGSTSRGVDKCESNSGKCVDKTASACTGENDKVLSYKCYKDDTNKDVDTTKICCMTII